MFNLTLTGFLDWLWAIIFSPMWPVLLGLGLLTGCTIHTKDAGEVSVMFNQGVTFKHTTSKTDGDAEVGIDGKPLVEHVLKLRKGEGGGEDGGP